MNTLISAKESAILNKINFGSVWLISYHNETKNPNLWSLYGKPVIVQQSDISSDAPISIKTDHVIWP
jgi:hypothetical protein